MRRVAIPVVCAAALIALIAGTTALLQSGGRGSAETSKPSARTPTIDVPWRPEPVTATPSYLPADESSPCADSELSMQALFATPEPGQRAAVGGLLEIRNTGKRTCRVQSKFTWFPVGVTLPANFGVTAELGPAAIIAPGGLAVSALSWWGAKCAGTEDLTRIQLMPHSNDGLTNRVIRAHGLHRGPCPREFGDVGSGSWAVALAGRPAMAFARLVAILDAPPTAKLGKPVRFTVTLTNVSRDHIAFDPAACPTVAFGFGDGTSRHRLQCRAVPALAPGGAVRFHFEAPAPAERPRGSALKTAGHTAELQWSFEALPFDGTLLSVRLE